jgi:Autophagy-related protein 101
VTPRDVECEGFALTYTRIAGGNRTTTAHKSHSSPDHNTQYYYTNSALNTDVDQKVDDAIEAFLRTLSQIGPELLSGGLTLSFFERRATRQLFGLVSHEDRVMYETLHRVNVVMNTPRDPNDSHSSGSICSLWLHLHGYRWEQWILRVVVNNTPRPISNDTAAVIERQRIQVRLHMLFVCSESRFSSIAKPNMWSHGPFRI